MRQLAAALMLTLAATAGMFVPARPAGAVEGGPKIVIIVGATHGATESYRQRADAEYAEAIKHSSNVVRIYSPNATWDVVRAAVAGASIVIYHGHGNGWPSPYTYDPNYTTKNGFGLNAVAGQGDYNNKYYGEPFIETLKPAANAVVLLHNLCYAAGNSEPGSPDPTDAVARQRADNYASAFLRAGFGAVIAGGLEGASYYIGALMTTDARLDDIWRSAPGANGNVFSFPSVRTAGATISMDPEVPGSKYYRAASGNLALTATDVRSGVPAATPGASTPSTVGRLSGVDRYGIAPAVSAVTYAPGVPVAYVATGLGFADALAGAAPAGYQGGPLLLVPGTSISASVAAELSRLQPARIVVLGGTGAVSEAVAQALQAYTAGPVERAAGPNRYATAAAVSAVTYAPGVPVAYIATGLGYADALAGAAAAGYEGGPILLVPGTSIPAVVAAELSRLQPARIVVLGGTGVVSAAVALALQAYTAGPVDRAAGPNRYATAAAISAATYAPGVPVVYVATGLGDADALAAAAPASYQGGPLLLVPGTSIPAVVAAELSRLQPARIVVLGGTSVVSEAVLAALSFYTRP